MEKVLLSGGAGFIGSHLAERLLKLGKRVAIVDNLDDYYSPARKRANLKEVESTGDFEFFPADIRNSRKLRQVFQSFAPHTVIHLAARPGVRASFADPETCTSINVLGTLEMLEASRLGGIARFIFASSSSVYGESARAPFHEDAVITRPLSVYAATKAAGEALAFTYARAYSLPVTCLRFFTVYGPRQRPDLAIYEFAKMILDGKEVPLYNGGTLERDFTYIDDIVDGVELALGYRGNFDVFNLGNAKPVRVDVMVDTLARALGKPPSKKFVPAPAGEMALTHADLGKSRALLGYSPKVSFEEGMRRFAEWFRLRS